MEVGIEHGEIRSVLVEHLIGLHIRMIDGDVLVLLERDAVELVGQAEDAVDDLLQLEVGTQHLCVDVIFLQLQLVRIEGKIPGFQILSTQLIHLLDGRRLIGSHQLVEQAIDAAHILRHAAAQHIVGIGLVAEQLCNLAAQVDQALANLNIVVLVVVDALRVVGHIHLAAQFALRAVGHKGRIAGSIEGENPFVES